MEAGPGAAAAALRHCRGVRDTGVCPSDVSQRGKRAGEEDDKDRLCLAWPSRPSSQPGVARNIGTLCMLAKLCEALRVSEPAPTSLARPKTQGVMGTRGVRHVARRLNG